MQRIFGEAAFLSNSTSIWCSRSSGAGMDANESFVLNESATYRRLLHFLSFNWIDRLFGGRGRGHHGESKGNVEGYCA